MNVKVIEQVAILFMIMAVGVFARKKGILTDAVKKGLTELILNITMPLMIFGSFNQQFSSQLLVRAGQILLVSAAIHLLSYYLGALLFRRFPADQVSVLRYITVISNAGFMGYPVLDALYGQQGIFYASFYTIPFNIAMLSLGVLLFSKQKSTGVAKQILLHPAILAVGLGLIPFLFSLQLPAVISRPVNLLGNMTTPLSMLVIGAMIADTKLNGLFERSALYGSLIRLLVVPLLTLVSLKVFGLPDEIVGISVVLTAMPAGAMTAIMAGKYDANPLFASKCVFVSTLMSLGTIPLVLMLI